MKGGNKSAAHGSLNVSEDVVITAARLAALDVKGVAGLDGEVNMLSRLRGNSPIRVSFMGDVAAVDIKIIVKSGTNARIAAEAVQKAVKENIQNMTGDATARVNVLVDGVEFE
ncbi:MAG: Asp23/Gls24 family envelope stress response protein [Ruminococcus sp.]|nr:Asp23/Gls24 family envelope stress response protein [Ruminococcus sp.]